jgi:hypothetical protein
METTWVRYSTTSRTTDSLMEDEKFRVYLNGFSELGWRVVSTDIVQGEVSAASGFWQARLEVLIWFQREHDPEAPKYLLPEPPEHVDVIPGSYI